MEKEKQQVDMAMWRLLVTLISVIIGQMSSGEYRKQACTTL
jgi:hypothetical protein